MGDMDGMDGQAAAGRGRRRSRPPAGKALTTAVALAAGAALAVPAGIRAPATAAPLGDAATTGAATAGPLTGGAGPAVRYGTTTSSNWAGYTAVGGTYRSVRASWTQAAVRCAAGATTWSSFWAGLDGAGTATVEQIGTAADCSSGRPSSYAWYELYPAYPVRLSGRVAPGDRMSASVTAGSRGSFTLRLTDSTRHWTRTATGRVPAAAHGSAEVVAEAPTGIRGVLPLSRFGTTRFSGVEVDGHALSSSRPVRVTMADRGVTRASTSPLGNGTAFTVVWRHG